MGEFSPSPEQLAAIETDGKALLISAAAGSGKTTVLVRRVLRLLCDGNPAHTADRLMVVTFTVAAAAKLKSDLSHKLSGMILQGTEDTRLLKKQRMLLPRAAIGTFDSFCKNICTEFFARLGIEPDFKIGERLVLDVLEAESMSRTMEIMLLQPDFAEFASNFANPRSVAGAQDAILSLHRRMISMPFPEQYINRQAENAKPLELRLTPAGKILFTHAQETLSSANKCLKKAVELGVAYGLKESPLSVLQREEGFVLSLLTRAQSGDYKGMKKLFAKGPSGSGYDRFTPNRDMDEDAKQLIKALRGIARDMCNSLYEKSFTAEEDSLPELSHKHHRMAVALCDATLLYYKLLTEAKREASCFDFYDLQHMTAQLIAQPDLQLTERFFAIMVDEYQDTNPIADFIYHTLAGKNTAALFLVGDVKQSIYGFNAARPDIFADRVQSNENKKGCEVIYLAKNYRSYPQVIANINDLFTLIMSKDLGGIDYDINNRLHLGRKAGPTGNVELHLCREDDLLPVAEMCDRLIQNGTPAEDICILVQTNKAVAEYARALASFGVMAELGGDKPLSEEVGAMPLIALLRFIANPFSEVDLIAVLLSPLFGFSSDDVAALYIGEQKRLIIAMTQSPDQKVTQAAQTLWELHRFAATVSVRVLLQRVYECLNAYVICCAMSATATGAIADIETLALQYDRVGQGGITGFVRRLNLVLSGSSRAKKESNVKHGYVNVMTIHNSKGLEFPVCIIAGTAKPFNMRDLYSSVLQHDSTSIGMKLSTEDGFIDTPYRRAAAIANTKELMSELMRLLYVATTRAMGELYMFVTAKDKKIAELAAELYGEGGITPQLLERQTSFSDILVMYALCNKDGELLRELSGDVPVPIAKTEGQLNVCIAPPPDMPKQEDKKELRTADISGYGDLFAWRYPNIENTKKPIKHSVSELLQEYGEVKPTLKVPSFSIQGDTGGAKRGSITHAFLQQCNLKAGLDVPREIKRLVDEAFISSQDAELINIASVKKFLSSQLAVRIFECNELYREYEFITEYDGMVIQGIVDLILVEQDGVVIVDYKTTRADEQELKKLYARQLDIYSDAMQRRFNLPIKQKIIYSLSLGKEIFID